MNALRTRGKLHNSHFEINSLKTHNIVVLMHMSIKFWLQDATILTRESTTISICMALDQYFQIEAQKETEQKGKRKENRKKKKDP